MCTRFRGLVPGPNEEWERIKFASIPLHSSQDIWFILICTYFSKVKFVIWNDFTMMLKYDEFIVALLFSINLFSFRKENN